MTCSSRVGERAATSRSSAGSRPRGVEDAVAAIDRLDELDRAAIRRRFERRFSAARMMRDYVAIYESLASAKGRRVA